MAKRVGKLKLGKSASFVKTKLKQLPQVEEAWEVDFRVMPKEEGQVENPYLGFAISLPRSDPVAYLPVEYTPCINDLADLLAEAMGRPLTGEARRPRCIHHRADLLWEELLPHLKDIGIETEIREELSRLEEARTDFLREMRRMSPTRVFMVPQTAISLERQFPAVAQWIQDGHIEIGDQEGFGFVVRALDYGGMVFEEDRPRSLTEALISLEKGIRAWFEEQGIDLEG